VIRRHVCIRHVCVRLAAGAVTALAALAVAVAPVGAHASIPDGDSIPAGGTAVIHVRIPHGCDGAAVTAVKVQLPDGVVGARPEAVPGWSVTTEMVPANYTLFGTTYTERVGTVTWTGGPLPDGEYLDFGILATFQLEPGEYALPVIQECGADSVAWVEVPAAGQSHDDLEHPAPMFTVVEAAEGGDHDHGGGAAASPTPSDDHAGGDASGDLTALAADLADLKAKVTAIEATSRPSTPSNANVVDPTATLAIAVAGLVAGLGGSVLGLVAIRRRR
jgi:uncharacterized protein YcnI